MPLTMANKQTQTQRSEGGVTTYCDSKMISLLCNLDSTPWHGENGPLCFCIQLAEYCCTYQWATT